MAGRRPERHLAHRVVTAVAAVIGALSAAPSPHESGPATSSSATVLASASITSAAATVPAPTDAPSQSAAPNDTATASAARATSIVLVAGGDISFGRDLGQTLLREPGHDFFGALQPLLDSGDLRFANLESQLSDQKGQTQSPWVKLVFTGPPEGAAALARARFDVVSTANNHAWDYGRKALFETLDNLDRAGVAHAGTGRTRDAAYAPAVVERGGVRIAFLAVTEIWNQGSLRKHAAAEHVAGADAERLFQAVRDARARPDIAFVVVSHHGGVEYLDLPLARTRTLLHAVIDAGADVVLGHHPHVAQGIEWHHGRPILYSMGNLVMQMSEGRPDPSGYVARLHLSRAAPAAVEACPLRFPASAGKPLAGQRARAALEKAFFARLTRISKPLGGIEIAPTAQDGCAPVRPAGDAPAR